MKTKLLGILSISGGMLISSHAFGENIMGYSEADLKKSVQETAYKFWEHCPKGDHDEGKIGGLEFLKPEETTPGGKPEPEKKPDPGAANKWEGVSWSQLKTDDEKREFIKYANDNKRSDMLKGIDMTQLIKYSPKPSGKKDIPPPKKDNSEEPEIVWAGPWNFQMKNDSSTDSSEESSSSSEWDD